MQRKIYFARQKKTDCDAKQSDNAVQNQNGAGLLPHGGLTHPGTRVCVPWMKQKAQVFVFGFFL